MFVCLFVCLFVVVVLVDCCFTENEHYHIVFFNNFFCRARLASRFGCFFGSVSMEVGLQQISANFVLAVALLEQEDLVMQEVKLKV